MASVIEKRRADGRTYDYLVESARVDGKPRIVSQQYLGSAEEVAAKLSAPGRAPRSVACTRNSATWPPPGRCLRDWT
jgi:hypothetical protein